jgi:serine protease AprX
MGKFYIPLLLIFLFISLVSEAQSLRYTVKFRYKKADGYSLSQPSAFLSEKAIQRRTRQKITIDSTDLPVNREYLDSLESVDGVKILRTSKWLNQVLVEMADINALGRISSFPFVITTTPVAFNRKNKSSQRSNMAVFNDDRTLSSPASVKRITSDTINYGNNYPQVHIHEGEYLHNQGFRGRGITIAVLDGGFFNYKQNPAFDSVRVNNQILGEYDFVNDEASVEEDHVHGSNCLSIMAANRPGVIVGTAPAASYWLFRTEDAGSERPVEELNWIEAAERADSAGADMISSSLGYVNFDDPSYNHSYAQRNGNTVAISIAADLAVKKGMIVMNSVGNSGNDPGDTRFVMCPADGDSVMTVGAVNNSGVIGGFSSWGPSSSGKVKPNIVSVGAGAVFANAAGDASTGNGTSYSNPNVAGLIACLWEAYNEFTNMEIIDAVQKSADRYTNPDERYGYGIPNFRVAASILEEKREERANAILQGKWITAFPVPFRQLFTLSIKAPSTGTAIIRIVDVTGQQLLQRTAHVRQGSYYNFRFSIPGTKRFGVYYLQYHDGKNSTVIRLLSL